MPLSAGEKLGVYEIVAQVGVGGMGEVYSARDTKLGRQVAIKVLPGHLSADASARERLRREAAAAAALDHPFICKVFEIGEERDEFFLVMEFIAGETLHQRLRSGSFPLKEALRVSSEVAEALEVAHNNGFVHRDLKPANVMLTQGHVKVMDFGLAKRFTASRSLDQTAQTLTLMPQSPPLTEHGATIGTPDYMSPEQVKSEPLDQRSDLFSFGILLCELMGSPHPFRRASATETMAAILRDPPNLSGSLPQGLKLLIRRLLAKSPDDRYSSIAEARADLTQLGAAARKPFLDPVEDCNEIRVHVAQMLASKKFANAPYLSSLLRYIVERTLEGGGGELREYVLGVDVFRRGTDFDPKIDSIVRVQARRLRQKLDAYYAEEAVEPGLRISLQPGSYLPSFTAFTATPMADAAAIAVLPFAAIGSPRDDAAYLSEGFTNELIHAISRTAQKQVLARASNLAGRDASLDPRRIGRRLGVRRVITGSLRWNAGAVTVLAQLVDVESGLQEWSEHWDQPEHLLFTLPTEIAKILASAVHREARPDPAPIEDPEAIQMFLRGRYYWNQRTEQGFRQAVEYYRQALDLDPAMSRVWAALSETYLLLAMHGMEPPRDVLPKAKAAAERGLLFDPRSAACHAAHGAALLFFERDVSNSERAWRVALDLDPRYGHAWHSYAIFFLASQRRWDEAMSAILEAERLDPLSAPVANDIGFILYWSGSIERARAQCKRTIDAHPWFYRTYMLLARCHAAEGDLAGAIDIARRALPLFKGRAFYTYHLATLGFCDARCGNTAAAKSILAEMEAIGSRHYYSKIDRALVYHGLRDRTGTAQWIDQAAHDRNPWEVLRQLDPLWRES